MKIKTSKPIVLWNLQCTLGEGTLWVKEQNTIYFVDIKKKKIFSLNIKTKKRKIIKLNKKNKKKKKTTPTERNKKIIKIFKKNI